MKRPDAIRSKTPDEIKKGLESCILCWTSQEYGPCHTECIYRQNGLWCRCVMNADALTYIQQLESDNESKQKRIDEFESRLAKVERERDVALKEWKRTKMDSEGMCWTCKHGHITDIGSCRCVSPYPCDEGEEWEWRGVCPENTKEE